MADDCRRLEGRLSNLRHEYAQLSARVLGMDKEIAKYNKSNPVKWSDAVRAKKKLVEKQQENLRRQNQITATLKKMR